MKKSEIRNAYDVHLWLDQVRKWDQLVEAKVIEREQLWSLATKTTQGIDGMPHGSGVSDKVGNLSIKLAELSSETDGKIDEYINLKMEVIRELERLPEKEYSALHRRYIRYMPWNDIAHEMGYCEMQIYRYRTNGLKHILQNITKERCC